MGVMQWQPIETAPKDGTEVLLYQPRGAFKPWKGRIRDWAVNIGYWHQPGNPEHPGYWMGNRQMRPTHWMPLPEPPREAS